MPIPIQTPRINNNDDEVRLAAILVHMGAKVRAGEPIVDVETDKATFTVEAPADGYLLGILGQEGGHLQVGSILGWIGSTPEEALPAADASEQAAASTNSEPTTLKALLLLKAHGLQSSDVPHSGRLKAADVERHVASLAPQRIPVQGAWPRPGTPGRVEPFSPDRKGMMRTVSWHRDEVAAGYVELLYDPEPWENYAAEFQKKHSLLMSPLLALMAWRLAHLAGAYPHLNATVVSDGSYLYNEVNLGFTVQAGAILYLVVLRDAASKSGEEFVRELGELQRAAMKHVLTPEQSSEATIGFTSMARWKVARHIPVLAPQTTLMVAHSAPANGTACLGASYDHRLLNGFDVAQALQKLSVPSSNR